MKNELMNAARRAASVGLSFACSKRRYYALFTGLFLLTALLVLSWFLICGRTLIYETDGWSQYVKAYVYYGRYLRQAARTLLTEHRLQLPAWDPSIGEGADVLGTLHYYVMGDPIALLAGLVPTRLMPQFYAFSILLRLYLAGLSFSALCFGMKIENRFGILAGALSYSFCAWAVRNVARHVVFLQPLITLPLIILGMEKICRKERPYLYVLAVMAAAVSNLYFFYMTAIMTAVCALVRLCPEYRARGPKAVFSELFRLAGLALLGTAMAGVIVLPVLRTLIADSRMGIDYAGQVLYSRNYYAVLPYVLLTAWNTGNYLCIGLTAPAFLACLRLFVSREGGRTERWLLLMCVAVILFPFGGRLMNGFSYASNRWCFGLALLSSFILAKNWDGLPDMAERHRRGAMVVTAGLSVLCLSLEKSRRPAAFVMLLLILFALQLLRGAGRSALRQLMLCLLVAGNVFAMSLFLFAPGESNLVSESVESDEAAEKLTGTEAALIAKMAKGPLPRYTGRDLTVNADMIAGVSSTQYYWSLSNPQVNAFRSDLELREMQYQKYMGYDDRTALIALSGAGYYVTDVDDRSGLPFGLEQIRSPQAARLGKTIYKNPNALPFGYCYDAVIGRDQLEQMDAVQKQQAMLTAALVEGDAAGLPVGEALTKDYSIPFQLALSGEEIDCGDGFFAVTGSKASVTLTFDGLPDAETYVELQGFDFTSTCRYDLYFGGREADPKERFGQAEWDVLSRAEQSAIRRERRLWEPKSDVTPEFRSSAKTVKKLRFLTASNKFTSGRRDFIINLGYAKEPQTSVTITFPARGIYRFRDLKVHAVPMEEFRKAIPLLKETVLGGAEIKTDTVRGSITAKSPKLLCLAISWSDGWTATLDGKEVPVLLTNGRYLGIAVPAGKHTVELKYHTPWLKEGALISLAGLAGFACLLVLTERRRRRAGRGSAAAFVDGKM